MLFDLRAWPWWHPSRLRALLLLACLLALVGCNFPVGQPTLTPSPSPPPSETPLPTVELTEEPTQVSNIPYDDAGPVLAGLCFRFLQTLGDHTVLLDSAADLAKLYDAVDASKQCRGTVGRQSFDFESRQIVGFVAVGSGCNLDLIYDHTELDDSAHQRTIVFRSRIDGDCPYELVHPIWLAVERQGYSTQIRVTSS